MNKTQSLILGAVLGVAALVGIAAVNVVPTTSGWVSDGSTNAALSGNISAYSITLSNLTEGSLVGVATGYGLTNATAAMINAALAGETLELDELKVGTIIYTNPPVLPSFAVAELPASSAGALAWSTDVLTTRGTGGRVYYDGTSWRLDDSHIVATSTLFEFMTNALAVGLDVKTPMMWAKMSDLWSSSSSLAGPADNDWAVNASGGSLVSLIYKSPEVPGGVGMSTGTGASGYCTLALTGWQMPSGAAAILHAAVNLNSGLPDGTENYWVFIGSDIATSGNSFNTACAGFLYDRYGGITNSLGFDTTGLGFSTNNWLAITRTNSVTQVFDTGVAAASAWKQFTVFFNTSSNVFIIDGAIVANTTTLIPATLQYPVVRMVKTSGTTARWLAVDRLYGSYRFAASRTFQ